MILSSLGLSAQENCINGVDDDGNGLIDLNDPACYCYGINLEEDLTNKIPNPNLAEMSCCPYDLDMMECVSDWQAGTYTSPDYMHTCGIVIPAAIDADLVPFPCDDGAMGVLFYSDWKEYVSVCLNDPLPPAGPGEQYHLKFQLAGLSITLSATTCQGKVFSPVDFTLYGHATCNDLKAYAQGCPSGGNPPGWEAIGTVSVGVDLEWSEVTISFSPSTTISAIMLGPPCILPPSYSTFPCQAYFMMDCFELYRTEEVEELTINPISEPCKFDYSLEAMVNHFKGFYQWFFNGVAIVGQHTSGLPLAANNFQSGTYQVTYSYGGQCLVDSFIVNIPERDTIQVESQFCAGSSYSCAGEIFYNPGNYYVNLVTAEGCDSVVLCTGTEYDAVPITELVIDSCNAAEIKMCGQTINSPGLYEFYCTSYLGCDSIVSVELGILNPVAVILPPDELTCDSTTQVILNGSLSHINPYIPYSEDYQWTGPPGGIIAESNLPEVIVVKPGKYCLTVSFGYNGLLCSDTACVIVTSTGNFPDVPDLQGPSTGCLGDTLIYAVVDFVSEPGMELVWIFPADFNFIAPNDSTIYFIVDKVGMTDLCGFYVNECGQSDTACIQIMTGSTDTVYVELSHCDISQTGTFQQNLLNSAGCDSIVITQINHVDSDTSYITNYTCNPIEVGADTFYYQNTFNCDSIVINSTNLQPSHQFYQTFHTCDSLLAGMDTVYMTTQYGCDSILYVETIFAERYQETSTTYLCGPGGNYSDSLLISTGTCDSLFITNYIYHPSEVLSITLTTCDANQAGIVIDTFQNQFGCDSIVELISIFNGLDTLFREGLTCDSQQVGITMSAIPGPLCDTILVMEWVYSPVLITEEDFMICGTATGPQRDTLFFTTQHGCDSLVIRIFEYSLPEAVVVNMDESCNGSGDGQIFITSITGGREPYLFQLENFSDWQNAPLFSDLTPGNYTLYIRDSLGCTDTLIGITVAHGMDLVIDAGSDLEGILGAFITLNGTSNLILSDLEWTATDPISCANCLVTQVGPLTKSQTVIITGLTADGCIATDNLEIIINDQIEIYIPNSFSPNYDGINDVFSIFGNQFVASVRNLAIYDRWGNSLFYKEDLPINDPTAGWDGNFRGELMDPGVYIYVIEVELKDGRIKLFKGDVTLVR